MNGCILLYDPESETSAFFDYRDPDPRKLSVGAMELGMRSIIRFRGMTARPITNAEHSMRVGRFGFEFAAELGERAQAIVYLWGLLHDVHEWLTPWGDCPGPWKTDEMREGERGLDGVVWESLQLRMVMRAVGPLESVVTPELRELVARADRAALAFEALLWQPNATSWVYQDPELVAALDPKLYPFVEPRPGESWLSELRAACSEASRRI